MAVPKVDCSLLVATASTGGAAAIGATVATPGSGTAAATLVALSGPVAGTGCDETRESDSAGTAAGDSGLAACLANGIAPAAEIESSATLGVRGLERVASAARGSSLPGEGISGVVEGGGAAVAVEDEKCAAAADGLAAIARGSVRAFAAMTVFCGTLVAVICGKESAVTAATTVGRGFGRSAMDLAGAFPAAPRVLSPGARRLVG